MVACLEGRVARFWTCGQQKRLELHRAVSREFHQIVINLRLETNNGDGNGETFLIFENIPYLNNRPSMFARMVRFLR